MVGKSLARTRYPRTHINTQRTHINTQRTHIPSHQHPTATHQRRPRRSVADGYYVQCDEHHGPCMWRVEARATSSAWSIRHTASNWIVQPPTVSILPNQEHHHPNPPHPKSAPPPTRRSPRPAWPFPLLSPSSPNLSCGPRSIEIRARRAARLASASCETC